MTENRNSNEIKKFVFRVSNSRNLGPFRNKTGITPFRNVSKFNDMRVYPTFYRDNLPDNDENYLASLPNACALFHWFGEDLDYLADHNFKVRRIQVSNFKTGKSKHQSCYHKRDKIGKMKTVPIKYKGLLYY
jgi:hypothetical protein